jgi:triosephosphate isomerase
MKKRTVVANWKMNPESMEDAFAIAAHAESSRVALSKTELIICPPAIFLEPIARTAHTFSIGAQNVAASPDSAQTGELSAFMLKNSGVSHVIIGHSERRAMGENNMLVNGKVLYALKSGLSVVVCVGEKMRDVDGFYLKDISSGLEEGLAGVQKKNLSRVMIAYEPIWAIGKHAKGAASPADVLEISLYIKKILMRMFGKEGGNVSLLYGGSVDAKNAADFVKNGGVDGLLVGRESINTKTFPILLSLVDAV